MVCRLRGGNLFNFIYFLQRGKRVMSKTGRRWSFLLAFEEVQDERGLVGPASGGRSEYTHSVPLPALPNLDSWRHTLLPMLGLSNANDSTMIIKSDVSLVEKKHSKAGFCCCFQKINHPCCPQLTEGRMALVFTVSVHQCASHTRKPLF